MRKIIGVVHALGTQTLKAFVLDEATMRVAEIKYKWVAKDAMPTAPDTWSETVIAEAENASAQASDPLNAIAKGVLR